MRARPYAAATGVRPAETDAMRHAQFPIVVARECTVAKPGAAIRVRRAVPAVFCAVLLAAASGCSRSRAADVVTGPPLSVPAPPPRVITPAEEAPLASGPGRAEIPLAGAPEAVQERATVPPSPPPATAPRQQPAAAVPPAPSASTPTAELPRQVHIESAGDEAARRKEVDGYLASAERDLNRISQRVLNAQGRQQFEEAMSLRDAARRAVNERNFTFALTQAKKAATLAATLAR
jgi:hypothetical protein